MRNYLKILNDKNRTYQGPAMKVGIDLSVFPKNMHRVLMKDTGEIRPAYRTDGCKTDEEYWTKQLIENWPETPIPERIDVPRDQLPPTKVSPNAPKPKQNTQQPQRPLSVSPPQLPPTVSPPPPPSTPVSKPQYTQPLPKQSFLSRLWKYFFN